MRLSEMSKEALEKCVDNGDYSAQDVIDLFDDLQEARRHTQSATIERDSDE